MLDTYSVSVERKQFGHFRVYFISAEFVRHDAKHILLRSADFGDRFQPIFQIPSSIAFPKTNTDHFPCTHRITSPIRSRRALARFRRRLR